MEIKQMLVPDSKKPKYVINGKAVTIPMSPEWITIHETDNPSGGADDLAHARLQLNGNSRNASWHLQVDEDSCVQSLPFTECGLHAGDNMGPGNMKSIAIEICVNQGGNFNNAVKNAAEVTKQLMAQFNISIMKVVQHNKWSGKNCPRYLRSGEKGINWGDFINLLKSDPVPQPSTDKVTIPNTAYWQAKALVQEFEGRGFRCYGDPIHGYLPNETPKDTDGFKFVVETDFKTANQVLMELKSRGYDRTVWETI